MLDDPDDPADWVPNDSETADPAFGDNGVLLLDAGYGETLLLAIAAGGASRIVLAGSVGDLGFDGGVDVALAAVSK